MKSLFIALFLLFLAPTGLVAEEIDVSKGMVITVSSGIVILPPLNARMTEDKLQVATQATIIAVQELNSDITMYAKEEGQLLSDTMFYTNKTLEDGNALDEIINEHNKVRRTHQADLALLKKEISEFNSRPVSKQDKETEMSLQSRLSITEQNSKKLLDEKMEIIAMKKEFEESTSRLKSSLEAKTTRWANGNFIKLKLAENQTKEVSKYLDHLNNILLARSRVRPQLNVSAGVRYS